MITLTNVLLVSQLVAYVVGFTAYVVWVKADTKIARTEAASNFTIIKNDMTIMKLRADSQSETLKQLTAILGTVSVQDTRLAHIEEDIRDMKRGEGYILPLPRLKSSGET